MPSLFKQVMGAEFSRMSPALQRFHGLSGRHVMQGWVTVEAPSTRAARWLAMLLGSPTRAAEGPIRFELEVHASREVWTRHFPAKSMVSTLYADGKNLAEQLGASRLVFKLVVDDQRLILRLQGMRFWGLPCPRWLMPSVTAEETGSDNQLHFEVGASLPWIGRVAGYRGHLAVPHGEAP